MEGERTEQLIPIGQFSIITRLTNMMQLPLDDSIRKIDRL